MRQCRGRWDADWNGAYLAFGCWIAPMLNSQASALNERTNAHLQDGLSLRFYSMGLLRRCDPLVSVSIQQSCCRGLGKLVFSSPRYRGTLYGRCGALPFLYGYKLSWWGQRTAPVPLFSIFAYAAPMSPVWRPKLLLNSTWRWPISGTDNQPLMRLKAATGPRLVDGGSPCLSNIQVPLRGHLR